MKSKFILSVFAVSLFFFGCQDEKKEETENGKTLGSLYISSAQPNPGDELQIRYTIPEGENAEDVSGYYYYFVNSEVYPKDLDLKDSMGIMETTLQVPDSATAIAFNFKLSDSFDSNSKKGYVLPLYTEDGEIVRGGKASEGFYHLWVQNFGVETEQDSALVMIGTEIEKYPELRREWDQTYSWRLYREDSSKGEAYIKDRLAYYSGLENPTEADYSAMIQMQRILQNKEEVDSLQMIAAEKFPMGETAKTNYFMKFRQTADLQKQEDMLAEYDSKFGDYSYKDLMVQTVANTYLKNGNEEKFLEISKKISDKESLAMLYNNAAWNLAEKGKNLDFAEKISKRSLELLQAAQDTPESKPEILTQNQYLDNLDSSYEMYADTYAYILFKQGKTEEALSYQKLAVGDGKSSDVNERYVQYLIAANNWEMAQKTAARYIKENVATAKTKEYFKKAYTKNTGSEEGFQAKLASLEKEARAKTLSKIKSEMLNEPAPKFSMMDANGKEVSLESLKGKTVILDFWATWCGPCKASFPGMQIAVEKYKNNPDVAFFFVNTFESGKSPEDRQKMVADFIEKNDYDFHVLFDPLEKEGGRTYATAEKFGITGIPTKIIIGPDGILKFKEVGYGGNNERMVQKIGMMIELSKS
ncbi:MAG TPA: TlpA disulfide reductase family protein [Flavobacteriaceae bacterium]|nr:TlpA disulfide reductase family protein [Flavobacteriaceae bacterium]